MMTVYIYMAHESHIVEKKNLNMVRTKQMQMQKYTTCSTWKKSKWIEFLKGIEWDGEIITWQWQPWKQIQFLVCSSSAIVQDITWMNELYSMQATTKTKETNNKNNNEKMEKMYQSKFCCYYYIDINTHTIPSSVYFISLFFFLSHMHTFNI